MFKAWDNDLCEKVKENVLNAVLQASFQHTDKPVCFDKNRGWPSFFELAQALIGDFKCLVTVRDLRDVITSFEKLFRMTSALGRIPQDDDPLKMRIALNRIRVFISDGEPIGRAFNAINDSILRGWLNHMYFVDYEKLTNSPENTMECIYEFLGEEPYDHDFDNVEQITHEDDDVHGFKNLHKIRPKVKPQPSSWQNCFDDTVFKNEIWQNITGNARFWEKHLKSGPIGPNL